LLRALLPLCLLLQVQAPPPLPAPPAEVAPAPVPVPAAPIRAEGRPEDKGDFKVVYEKVKNPEYREIQGIFRGTQLLEETAKALNEELALPADVTVALRECGTADASYDPAAHRISLCYELVSAFADVFLRDARRPEDADRAGAAVGSATVFVMFHEAGHALIDLYQLPLQGGVEEAADQLSTLVLLASGREGEVAALDSASTLLAEVQEPAAKTLLDRLPFWSGHGLAAARFSNILCWVYGKNPAGFQDQVDATALPPERAQGCAAEHERMTQAWEPLLAPYVKDWGGAMPTMPAMPAPAPAPATAPPAPSPPPPTP
jgi:putative metallopeptidase DUF4344